MGSYLNEGNRLFQECLNSEIYVDKSRLIHFTNRKINTEQKFICVSRPRRFGKSMALKMLLAYYSGECDSRELFAKLKVCQYDETRTEKENQIQAERFEKNLNHYRVLYIDMQGLISNAIAEKRFKKEEEEFFAKFDTFTPTQLKIKKHPMLSAMQRELVRELRKNPEFDASIPPDTEDLGCALLNIHAHTDSQFVILIDEWDCIFRNYEEDIYLQDKFIDWLRGMFKDAAKLSVYALVYMTGILPIKRYNTQSAMNNFYEYTMLEMTPLEEFAGFTEEEVMELYDEYGMDIDKAKEWYDGYQLGDFGHIYNPNAIVKSIERRKFKSYWIATGTYESIKRCIDLNFDGLKDKVITTTISPIR